MFIGWYILETCTQTNIFIVRDSETAYHVDGVGARLVEVCSASRDRDRYNIKGKGRREKGVGYVCVCVCVWRGADRNIPPGLEKALL